MEKQHPDTDYIQLDFFDFLPGYAGGRALYIQRGAEHFRQLASISAGRPEHERRKAAQNAAATRLRKVLDCCVLAIEPERSWRRHDTLFCKELGEHRFRRLPAQQTLMNQEQQLLNQRLRLLTTRIPNGFD